MRNKSRPQRKSVPPRWRLPNYFDEIHRNISNIIGMFQIIFKSKFPSKGKVKRTNMAFWYNPWSIMATSILPIKFHSLWWLLVLETNSNTNPPALSLYLSLSFEMLVNEMKIHLLSPQQRLKPVCTTRLIIFNLNYEIELLVISQ